MGVAVTTTLVSNGTYSPAVAEISAGAVSGAVAGVLAVGASPGGVGFADAGGVRLPDSITGCRVARKSACGVPLSRGLGAFEVARGPLDGQ